MTHLALDQLLLDDEDEVLSPLETRELVSGPINAEIAAYIYLGLQEGKIDPNDLLAATLESFSRKGHLLILALAIRNSADPNGYPGGIHVLVLAARALRETNIDLKVAVYALLIVSGSSPDYKAREQPNPDKRTVLTFLSEEDIPINDIQKLNNDHQLKSMKLQYRDYLGIVLDRPDLVGPLTDVEKEENVIAAFASLLYHKIKAARVSSAIKTYNNEYLSFLLDKRARISYRHVNEVILQIRKTVDQDERALTERSSGQLAMMIKYGVGVDKYQYAMLMSVLKEKANLMIQEYSEPRWKKECRNSAPPSKELKRLAFGLNIKEERKEQICETLKKYEGEDEKSLRSRSSFSSSLREDKRDHCANRSELSKDPDDLPSVATVSYISRGQSYCIPSDLYELSIKTKVDPFSSDPLPASVIAQMKDKLNVLRKYKILPVDVPTFSSSLALLDKPDEIKLDEDALNDFAELAIANGISKRSINSLTPKMGEELLKTIKIQTNLTDLDSPEHATMTVIEESLPVIEDNPNQIKAFFRELKNFVISEK